ncbi:hypothetical protein DCAR_0102813 [Daucus carota subsp. sativus]|uniref:Uncharacterized protein n=1 Tax=Daucus carota subsp. sativus TaxID=79200 RepID=A0A166HB37_DAUCS|nr:hypothetical protein DCAR_0102813 [Daucus carota subsp. sativus]
MSGTRMRDGDGVDNTKRWTQYSKAVEPHVLVVLAKLHPYKNIQLTWAHFNIRPIKSSPIL